MKNLNAFFIALAFLGVSAAASAQIVDSGSCGDNLTWQLTGAGSNLTLTISGTGAMTDYVITAPWNSQAANIKTLILEDGITAIGNWAFSVCTNFTEVTIPNSVTTIGISSFDCCSGLASLTIPNSIQSMGDYAFNNCTGLTTVNFNATNCTTMGSSISPAFNNCTGLTTVNIGENVKSIPDYAFVNCTGLTGTLTIPNSVTSIGTSAFYRCNGLTGTLTIPDSVTSIGDNAFVNCSGFTGLTIGNSVATIGGYAFQSWTRLTGTLTIPDSVVSIGNAAFNTCSGLTAVNFNATNCTTMGSYSQPAFQNCINLNTLNIGKNVKAIPAYAFSNSNLTGTLTIPDSVASIGNYAFAACNNVTELTIGKNVASIGSNAFLSCSNIANINSLRDVPPVAALGANAFQNVPGSIPVNIPCGMKTYYANDPGWSSAFSGFHEIGSYAITVESNDNAMGTASVTQQPDCTNNQATIQAYANSGYKFTKWSDNNTDNPRTITLSSDTTLTAIFEIVSGIEKMLLENISIYPNPVKNELFINVSTSLNAQINNVEIADLAGKTIINCQLSIVNSINVSSLPAGIYIVKINTDKWMIVRKMVKN